MDHVGVIEGFYGPPWTWEARLEVAEAAAAAGAGRYVYAPKDDPKHRHHWRQAYSHEEQVAFERFTASSPLASGFALSPGLDIDHSSHDDVRLLLDKLVWATKAGFDLVVLALDDIPIAPGSGRAHAALWARLREKLDPVPVLLVPSDYTSTAPTPYLDELVAGLGDEPCSIGWTGARVVNDVITVAEARGRREACGGRPPLLWDNTPVNDAVMSDRLHLGPYRGREPGLRDELDGLLLNPMVQARASLPNVLSALGWARGEDPDEVWADVVEARGWRRFAEAVDGGPGRALLDAGDLDGLDAWLAAVDTSAPGLEDEVAPWVEQLAAEVALARRVLVAGRAADAFKALAALAEWRRVQAESRHAVLGARRSLVPSAAVGPDGRFVGGPGMLRDDNLLDLLVHHLFG